MELVIISRREAFIKNVSRFFTGKPCKYGHLCERQTSNGACIDCLKINLKKNSEKNREKTKRWRINNPEKYKDMLIRNKEKKKLKSK